MHRSAREWIIAQSAKRVKCMQHINMTYLSKCCKSSHHFEYAPYFTTKFEIMAEPAEFMTMGHFEISASLLKAYGDRIPVIAHPGTLSLELMISRLLTMTENGIMFITENTMENR